MKLFVDSGNIKDIETLAAIGIIDGVTTNPSLLAKEPGDYRQNLKKICDIVKGPVSGEVVSTEFSGMIREGHDIAKIDPHMVDARVFRRPGHPRREGRRIVRQPLRRAARRRGHQRDGADSRHRDHL